ncbi:DUF6470 family protein [Bacillus sp. 1P06AnD]|uniref:DUF6470 family protein n=1 Tax=Bacillus sp. 1P06AnD TaxID=3132208 RepID=UPI0039A2203B
MRVPQIRLESQPALISLKTNNAVANIEQPGANIDIEQPKAEMDIERTPSRLTIDQTAAWEAMDLKSSRRRTEEYAADGEQALLDGMARRAQDGDELMQIEYGGDPIAEQAKRNSEQPEKQFNLGFIPPMFSVKLDYDPGKVEVNWQTHKPNINSHANKPVVEYQRGNVDVGMLQKNSLTVDFVSEDI